MKEIRDNNKKIIDGIFDHDSVIVKQVIRDNYRMIRRMVLNNNGRHEHIKDLMHDALIAISQKKNKPEITSKFSSYYYSVCKNIWINKLNREKKADFMLPFDENSDYILSTDNGYSAEEIEFVRSCIEQMSRDCYKVITLFNQGLTIKELTRYMRYSNVQITKNKRYLCIKKLIEQIKNDPKYRELIDES